MKRPNIHEGDLFAVPLREGGYALGVVARKGKGSILLGYFFGPKRETIPTIENVGRLSPNDAILVECFGYLGLRDRTWPILGSVKPWVREGWSIPPFGQTESGTNRAWKVIYGDDLTTRTDEPCSAEVAATLRPNSLFGAGAIEIVLTDLLRT